jgi:predicted phage tail protein
MRLLEGAVIQGSKGGGGGSAHTPVEQPDDLLSIAKLKMLLAISEGEIQGDLTAQQIYLNDTQLANEDGTYNFTGVVWDWRKGTQDQTYIQGMPEVDNELSVGVAVTQAIAWTRQFTNLALDAVRIKLSLPVQYQYKDNGDMVGTVTQYAIDLSTDGGSWVTVVDGRFDGKTTSEYQRDHRIDLPKATSGWSVRVRRITADSSSSKLINAFKVFSFAEVIDSKLRYPNTALLYIEVDASQFSGQAPKVTCKPKGRLVRVPTTYDPVSRSYAGTWQGDFKYAYTDNPAWIFYDLVLDKIFGMGTRVDATMIDKWELYSISQYCDQMVSDGAGGTEPRFTCNVFIQSQQDAYTVLKDIAAIFRGITFWGNSQIFVNADVPQVDSDGNVDVDFVYHAANVIDGLFTYAGGSYKNRYTSCQSSWSDPVNHYSDTVEGVYDSDLVQRYGVREMSLTAIGCTSQSEAHRRGRWAILSNAKDGTVSFGVGLDGYIPIPAEIIGVADPFRSGKQNGGRISSVNGLRITLDRQVDYAAGDRLVVNLPDGTAQTRTIGSISADKKTVSVNTSFRITPVAGAVWAIDSYNLAIQYFRITSVAGNDDGTFTITGVQHDPNKYRYIDDGVRIEPAPITVTPISVLKAPANITISEVSFVEQGLSVSSMQVTWDRVEGAISYVAQWRKDKGDWVNVSQTSAQGFSIQGIYTGVYDVRVRGVNAAEISSPWGYADSTSLTGKAGKPGTPVNLRATDNVVWAIDVTWAFPDGSGDTSYTEVQVATTADGQNPQFLAYVPYPGVSYQHGPMPAGVRRWYRARLVDRIGNTGDWTKFVEGASSVDATALLGDITEQVLKTDAGKQLIAKVDTNIDAMLQNALNLDATVDHQMAESGKNRADILTVKQTLATNEQAYAQKFEQIQATVDQNTAVVQQTSTALADTNGKLSAQYSVKVAVDSNGRQYAAGMGIGVENSPSGMQTQVLFLADRFAVMSQVGATPKTFFAIQNGQTIINQAFIGEATITSAMIAAYIQSTNYVAGTTGWNLNKDGTFSMNGSVAGEGRCKLESTGLSVLSADGSLVQVGRLTGVF